MRGVVGLVQRRRERAGAAAAAAVQRRQQAQLTARSVPYAPQPARGKRAHRFAEAFDGIALEVAGPAVILTFLLAGIIGAPERARAMGAAARSAIPPETR